MNNFNQVHKKVRLCDVFPEMNEILEGGGSVTLNPKGVSMMPLLRQGRDGVILKKTEASPQKYDIAFYTRPDGQFVLHRIVGKKGDGYVLRGDNQVENEYGVKESQIIAIVTHICRDGKVISCKSFNYKLYTYFLRPIRQLKIFVAIALKNKRNKNKKI